MLPSRNDLIAFERAVADRFNSGEIRAPVHLAGGNEDALIDLFRRECIGPDDWVATQWRSHYHCLLKGVPPDVLMRDVVEGRSITLCYAEQRVISSAIVGGVLPIAMGIAWALKRRGERGRVFAFVGDMTARTGICHEVVEYAYGHDLPLKVVVEDNGKSVETDTRDAWGGPPCVGLTTEYRYSLPWPHAGAGRRVQF